MSRREPSQKALGQRGMQRRDILKALGASSLLPALSASYGSLAASADEVTFASATNMATAIRSGELSALELIDACINRIEAVNPRLNAVVQLAADSARGEARKADAALARGDDVGPLHGVPFTIKDTLDTAGVITTAGTTGRAAYVPQRDATVVSRLKTAGGILLGKTNTPELALAGETDNLVYGKTNNPYDLSRTPGGSSGGSAAIVAAGGSPLGIGTDAWGSVRAPAHFCGVAGLKPTFGRVPRTGGAHPPGVGPIRHLTHIGPIARYVEDLELTLPIIAGPDWGDPAVAPTPLRDSKAVDIKELRVAYYIDNGIVSPTPETAEVVKTAANVLADSASSVTEDRPDPVEETFELLIGLSVADGGAWVKRLLKQAGTTEVHPWIARYFQEEQPMSTDAYGELLERMDSFRIQMLSFMQDYDVILCPAYEKPAAPHGETSHNGFTYAATYNITGWPVAVVRGGTSPDGLPIGVQMIARPWREDVALAVAGHLENALGGYRPPSL